MTAADILDGAAVLGVQLQLDGRRVLARPKARLTPALREAIRSNVDELRKALADHAHDPASERQDARHAHEVWEGVPSDLPTPMWAKCERWEGGEARRLWWRIARQLARRLEADERTRPALEAFEARAGELVDARDLDGLWRLVRELEGLRPRGERSGGV